MDERKLRRTSRSSSQEAIILCQNIFSTMSGSTEEFRFWVDSVGLTTNIIAQTRNVKAINFLRKRKHLDEKKRKRILKRTIFGGTGSGRNT